MKMMSHNDSCQRDLWESNSFLENLVHKLLDPVVAAPAQPSHWLAHQDSTPALSDAEAAWDRRWETEKGSCKWKSPRGGLQLDKVFNNKIPETADWRKAQYFSLSTNLLQSYTTPMQQHPQLHAVNNKQIYFHQPCWCYEKSAWA